MRNSLVFAVSCLTAAATHAADLPFRLATNSEVSALSQPSVIATPLNQTAFRTGAHVTVKKLSDSATSKAKRADQALSSIYKSAISVGTDPNPHPVPPQVQPGDFVYYEVNHDAVQAWASMSELGAPFVMIYADGKTEGSATASWNTRYLVAGTGSREVYAQFRIPVVTMNGRFEDAQPSLTWTRMHIDFLVNAYPAWSTETIRFNEIWDDPETDVFDQREKIVYFETFGQSLGIDAAHTASTARTITVKLGTYPAGKPLDFTLLFQVEGKLAAACGPDAGETVCGNVAAKVSWDPTAPQPTFFSKPAP
jgi:hypothetical protein